jgi:hypothetical protein
MMIKISHIILGLLIFFTDSGIRLVHHVCDICTFDETEIHIFTSSHDGHGEDFTDCVCHSFDKSLSRHDHHKDCNEKILKNNSKYLVEKPRTIFLNFGSFIRNYSGLEWNNRNYYNKHHLLVPSSESLFSVNILTFVCCFLC